MSLGGNAFADRSSTLTMAGQFDLAKRALAPLAELIRDGEMLLTHGNGPQVGHMLMRVEAAIGEAYRLPLEVCVAESAGELGYVLQQTLHNLTGGAKPVATVLTQVVVAESDTAFASPVKPVGPVLSPDQATRLIAAGGGGVPVIERNHQLTGVEAVVDKDWASALLARTVSADRLVLVTDVAGACIDFAGPRERLLRESSPKALIALADGGSFGAGSMEPKARAAADFVSRTGKPAVICGVGNLAEALDGRAGTQIRSTQ